MVILILKLIFWLIILSVLYLGQVFLFRVKLKDKDWYYYFEAIFGLAFLIIVFPFWSHGPIEVSSQILTTLMPEMKGGFWWGLLLFAVVYYLTLLGIKNHCQTSARRGIRLQRTLPQIKKLV